MFISTEKCPKNEEMRGASCEGYREGITLKNVCATCERYKEHVKEKFDHLRK